MKKLLISLIIAMALLTSVMASADIIDDCIKCPGLEAIFARMYKWTLVA